MWNCKRDGHDYNRLGVCRACGINRKQVEYEREQQKHEQQKAAKR